MLSIVRAHLKWFYLLYDRSIRKYFNSCSNHLLQYENPWTIPNLLCVCRIVLAPVLAHLIIQQHFHLSLALFMLAGATDLVIHTNGCLLTKPGHSPT